MVASGSVDSFITEDQVEEEVAHVALPRGNRRGPGRAQGFAGFGCGPVVGGEAAIVPTQTA